jgi:hypothetical protein
MCYWSEQLLLSRGCYTQGWSTQELHSDGKQMCTADQLRAADRTQKRRGTIWAD